MDRSVNGSALDGPDCSQSSDSLTKDHVCVTDVEGGFAVLAIPVHSACAGCHSQCLLAGEQQVRTLRLPLPQGMRCAPGDYVDLRVDPRFVAKASFFLYLIPAVILFLFALLGRVLAAFWGLQDPDLGSLLAIFFSIPLLIRCITFTRKKMGGVENIRIMSRSREE
ncbi:SoxR reducing system RseC family protein [bacterium]|nr:SoxR reducing system RseC family protein [bacterium]